MKSDGSNVVSFVSSCRCVGFVSLVRKRGICLVEGIDGKRVSLVSGDSQQQYGDGVGDVVRGFVLVPTVRLLGSEETCPRLSVGADGSLIREQRDGAKRCVRDGVVWTVRLSGSEETVLLRLSLGMKRALLVGVTANNDIVGQFGDSQR